MTTRTFIKHVYGFSPTEFQANLNAALIEIQDDLTPFEIVHVAHATAATGEYRNESYSALIVYRQTGPTREID